MHSFLVSIALLTDAWPVKTISEPTWPLMTVKDNAAFVPFAMLPLPLLYLDAIIARMEFKLVSPLARRAKAFALLAQPNADFNKSAQQQHYTS